MKLYEIKAFFPNGRIGDYAVRANNYISAQNKIASGKFEQDFPKDWKATVKFQCYRVR